MTSPDHRFRPGIIFKKLCKECASVERAPQHFGDHAGPVVPVPGFACGAASQKEATMSDPIRERAFKLFTPPFRFDEMGGYIWDAKGEMVADDRLDKEEDPTVALRVRGWGRLKYLPESEALYNEIGHLLAKALTAFWKAGAP